jgi:hypothetical protein
MFKSFLADPNVADRKNDYVVGFTLFGGYGGPATRRSVTVRTNTEARALQLVRREYRRSAEHKVLQITPLLACATEQD